MQNRVPADIATRFGALLARMQARGLTETVTIYGRVTEYDTLTQQPIARPKRPLGTLEMIHEAGTGTSATAQEGIRALSTLNVFYAQEIADPPLLSEQTYTERWLVRTDTADDREWRIHSYNPFGPYVALVLTTGGTGDAAGNVR